MPLNLKPKSFKLHVSGQKEPVSISVSTPNADKGTFEKMAKLTDKGNPQFKIINVDLADIEPYHIPQTYDPGAESVSEWKTDLKHFAGVTKAQIDTQLKKLQEEDEWEAKNQSALEFLDDKAIMKAEIDKYSKDQLIDTKPLFSLSASANKVAEDLKNLSKAIGGMNHYIPGKVVKSKENPLGLPGGESLLYSNTNAVPFGVEVSNLADPKEDQSKIVYAGDVLFDKFAGEAHDGTEGKVSILDHVVPKVELCMDGNKAPEHIHPNFKWVHTDVDSIKDSAYQAYRCMCPHCGKAFTIPFETIHGESFLVIYTRLQNIGIDPESLDGALREKIIKM